MLVLAPVPVCSAFSKRRRMLRQQQSYHLFGVDTDKSHHVPHALQEAVHVKLLRGRAGDGVGHARYGVYFLYAAHIYLIVHVPACMRFLCSASAIAHMLESKHCIGKNPAQKQHRLGQAMAVPQPSESIEPEL